MSATASYHFACLDPRTAEVARRLHAQADRQLLRVLPALLPKLPAMVLGRSTSTSPRQRRAMDDKFLALDRAQGAYCYAQARAVQARTVVEFGTSFGVSTLWLAAAVRDNGGGTVIGTELVEHKAEQARAHVREAGLEEYVDIRQGDARATLRDLSGPVDFLLNDGWPEAALHVLRLLTPALRPGAVVVTDNVGAMRGDYADYTAWIRNPDNGYVSLTVPFRTGTEVSVRTG
jgi:predicted O-methyltransferase YrrM